MKQKKILFIVQSLGNGGVSSVITNYHKAICEQIDADYIMLSTAEKVDKNPSIAKFLESQNSKVFQVTPFTKNMFRYLQEVHRIIASGHYDCVHDNNKYFSFLSLIPAKISGVPTRICHCHVTVAEKEKNITHRLFIYLSAWLSRCFATKLLACSEQSGRSMFGNRQFIVVNNAIDVEKYRFSPNIRAAMREELMLGNAYTLMMVARNDGIKRHDFAFQVFGEFRKSDPSARFVVVGCTEDELSPRNKRSFEMLPEDTRNAILFLGRRTDVPMLLQAADGFILTSEHEGLGISVVEAQAAGLPCFVSDSIPREVSVTDLVTFLPTVSCPEHWAEAIHSFRMPDSKCSYADQILESRFSISTSAKDLLEIYGCGLKN